ncbi:hypothetical protein [Peterkaempfera sp. SMS 1(5)a]|uniref:hypothetical protein n=1 Tax=Peterkaempfera podocarpi TaxID=3232308 RepID=UPI00366D1E1A
MILYPLPPPPDDNEDRSGAERRLPDSRYGNGGSGSWLRSRCRGRGSAHLLLHLGEAFLIDHGSKGPTGGLVRFRVSDTVEQRRPRSSWRTEVGRQLAGSGGELRLVRNYAGARATTHDDALIAILTLNGITDAAPLARLDISDPLPYVAGSASGHAAAVGVDIHFFAGLWNLAMPARTRCRVHLEAPLRLLPDWPVPS